MDDSILSEEWVITTLAGKYPAKAHTAKVLNYMREHGSVSGTLYLEGQRSRLIEDKDQAEPFHQRRYFYYLTGCELADCSLIYNIETQKSTLFIPPIDPEKVIWSGLPMTTEEALKTYEVDEVLPSTSLEATISSLNPSHFPIHAIAGQTSVLSSFSYSPQYLNTTLLKTAIDESRVRKTPYEVALIRHANTISVRAHHSVLRRARTAHSERELYADFLSTCTACGCPNQAYHSIVASGPSAATLHYIKNDAPLAGKLNLLLDAGGEYRCYASDITRTFPLNGTFTPESRQIYDLVLQMQKQCMSMLKAGAVWDDIQATAHRIAIEGLLAIGILRNGTVDEIFAARTSCAFFPHGLGHYLGLDTHDTGGHANYADPDPMFKYLRVRGAVPAGAVITVEPGIYFCRFIIEPALKGEKHARFIDKKVLERYWDVGGVRVEDDMLVTEGGSVNLTEGCVREREEVERMVRGEEGKEER